MSRLFVKMKVSRMLLEADLDYLSLTKQWAVSLLNFFGLLGLGFAEQS